MKKVVLFVGFLLASSVTAQESPNYRLVDYAFSSGSEVVLSSSAMQLTLVAIGDATAQAGIQGSVSLLDTGFNAAFPPPGEVRGLRFVDHQTVAWDSERSVGDYNLYRGEFASLSGLDYGQCAQQNVSSTTTTVLENPDGGVGYFYLVTAENRLDEEGTKGVDSAGALRPNPDPCP